MRLREGSRRFCAIAFQWLSTSLSGIRGSIAWQI
jgi:hypothetical protein